MSYTTLTVYIFKIISLYLFNYRCKALQVQVPTSPLIRIFLYMLSVPYLISERVERLGTLLNEIRKLQQQLNMLITYPRT
jgi:hypothetical protein